MAYKILIRFFFLIAVLLSPVLLFGQSEYSWNSVQHDFETGKIDANTLVNRQLSILEASKTSTGNKLKCATPVFFQAQAHWDELSAKTKENLTASSVPVSSASAVTYISDSGKFEIHYETSGGDAVPLDDLNSNSVPDYVEWVAEAADSSYNHEILTLGFRDPIPAGQRYRVFIRDLGFYGLTRVSGGEPAGTIIEIENDFIGFPPNTDPEGDQKGAVKVTMAHEFKHAIQYVQANWTGDSNNWVEMDATLYEELVYDDVNDYYNYLFGITENLFLEPQNTLIPGSYEDITWALYFHEEYGDQFWTEVWTRIQFDNSITWLGAIGETLGDYNTTFEEAVTEAAVWHYTSGADRSNISYGFEESFLYPSPAIREQFDSLQTELNDSRILRRFSAHYYEYELDQESTELVQFNFLAESSDLNFALVGYLKSGAIQTRFFNNPEPEVLTENQLLWSWENLERLGLVVFNSSSTSSAGYQFRVFDYFPDIAGNIELAQNYPNPFNPSTTINVTVAFSQQVRLDVYDYTGRYIQTLQNGILSAGVNPIVFNANGLASGVYYYRLESEDGVQIKKMMLIK